MKRYSIIVLFLLTACVTTSSTPPVDKSKMAEGYYLKGMQHFQNKDYELASVEFNRSIQSDDHYEKSYYMLGIINDYQGKLDDSVKYYKEAIDSKSNYSEAYNALGTAYSKQQKWKDALKAYNRALENKLYPTPHVPYLNIGRLYMAQKDYAKAADAYREAKRYANQDFIIYELGTALFEGGKIKESISEFREGVAMAPQNANLRYSLAIALLKDGNKKGAIEEFKKASELAPKSEIAQKSKEYIQTLR
jgi:pentatricopeptide repeat protein